MDIKVLCTEGIIEKATEPAVVKNIIQLIPVVSKHEGIELSAITLLGHPIDSSTD